METKLKLKENEVIHCKTEKQANKVLKVLHKLGVKWMSEDNLIEFNLYSEFKHSTCYIVKDCYLFYNDKKDCEKNDYTIITAKQFLKRHKVNTLEQRIEVLEAIVNATNDKVVIVKNDDVVIDSNEPKVGDICLFWDEEDMIVISKLSENGGIAGIGKYKNYIKATDENIKAKIKGLKN